MISKNNQESSHQINILSKRCMQSFVMHEISVDEVRTSINNVKAHTDMDLVTFQQNSSKLLHVFLLHF